MTYALKSEKEQKEIIRSYLNRDIEVIKRLNIDEIHKAMGAIWDAYEREATIYVFGNGGSAATASHFVCDFNKGVSEKKEKKFNLVCLNDNTSLVLAVANDISYDEIFRFQLLNKLKPTDLVIGISGSGNSRNVLNAVEYAKQIGTPVIGITGYHGGKLKEISDYHMDAMEDDMQISEDMHMIFDHMMYYVFTRE